ncbi:hypothetical protein ACX1N5_15250 [Acinetobacter sp. ANC 4636]
MTAIAVNLNATGALSLADTSNASLGINYDLYSYLGSDVQLKIQFFGKASKPAKGSQIICRMTWIDKVTDDEIYKIQGNLNNSEDDYSSLWNVAGAKEIFKSFELVYGNNMIAAILASDAYNAANSIGRNSVSLTLADDQPDSFDGDTVYKLLTSLDQRPSDLGLIGLDNLEVYSTLYRVRVPRYC